MFCSHSLNLNLVLDHNLEINFYFDLSQTLFLEVKQLPTSHSQTFVEAVKNSFSVRTKCIFEIAAVMAIKLEKVLTAALSPDPFQTNLYALYKY